MNRTSRSFRLSEHWLPILVVVICWLSVSGLCLFHEYERTGGLTGVPLDDAWIHFRYARNLANGYGFSFNPGEPSAGSTSPLWVILLALTGLPSGEYLILSKWLGAVLFLATAVVVYRIGVDNTRGRVLALGASLLTLLSGRFAWCSLSGMETSLFTFLALLAIGLWEPLPADTRSSAKLGLVLGAATLARPEGWGLFAIALLIQFGTVFRATANRRERVRFLRLILVEACAHLVLAAGYIMFCLVVSGRPLPNTFYVKTNLWDQSSFRSYLVWVVSLFALDNPATIILLPIGAGMLGRRLLLRGHLAVSSSSLVGVVWLVALPLAYGCLAPYTTIYYFRYLVPLVPVAALISTSVCDGTAQHLRRRFGSGRANFALSPIIIVVLFLGVPGLGRWADLFGRSVADIENLHVAAGKWLAEHSNPSDRVATHDIGAIGYLSDRHIIDLAGLISPSVESVLRGKSPGAWDDPVLSRIEPLEPRYVVTLDGWFPSWPDKSQLVPVHHLSVRRSTIATSNRMTVYEGRW